MFLRWNLVVILLLSASTTFTRAWGTGSMGLGYRTLRRGLVASTWLRAGAMVNDANAEANGTLPGQDAQSASSPGAAAVATKRKDGKMPITVLSGFLGAGKTTFLQKILSTDGTKQRFGLVVNDMAAVNVDSKLIRTQTVGDMSGIDTLELQNGCVCCTLAEDLMASVAKLTSIAEARGEDYDHIVVECSGIAEPRKIRELFQEADEYNASVVRNVKLDTLVTVVDASAFFAFFGSADADFLQNPRLAVAEGDKEGENMLQMGVGQRRVTELLLEQVECADVVLINKCDLLEGPEQVALVEKVVRSVNPTTVVRTCVRGELAQAVALLGSGKGEGAASAGILDEHRQMVASVERHSCNDPACDNPDHDHSHIHSHSHDHTHDHADRRDQDHDAASACTDANCTDHSHNHDDSCGDPTCTNPTHNHDHGHGSGHDHSHSHVHETETETTARARFGITSFVYRRRRPFHPQRFSAFLQGLGRLSADGLSDIVATDKEMRTAIERSGIKANLLRSKGFVWMGTSTAAAYFMSHAGQFLELVVLGRWWADIPRIEWPGESVDEIKLDFDVGADGTKDSSEFGDRRQELVFIGSFGDDESGTSQAALEKLLDSCLLTDEELDKYRATQSQGDTALRALWYEEEDLP